MATYSESLEISAESDVKDIDKAVDSLGSMSDALDDVETSGSRAETGSDKATGGFGRMGEMLRNGLTALSGFAAGIGLVTVALAGVDQVFAWDSALGKFQAQTGETNAELAEYRDIAQDVFTSGWGDSIDTVVGSMSQVERITGASGAELENITTNALILSDVFDADVAESTRTANTLMEKFGIDGEKAFDLITTGFQTTGDPAGDLLDTLNEYAGNFEQMGFTAEESLAILNSGLEAGAFNTDVVGDALREFNIRLTDGTSADAIGTLTKNTQDLFAAFQDGDATAADVFDSVLEDLNAIEDPIERNAAGVAIFGTQWEDLGEDAILALDSTAEALGEVDGATDAAGDAMQSGLAPAWERLKRTGLTLLANFLTPFITQLADKLVPVMEDVSAWLESEGEPAFTLFFETLGEGVETAGDIADTIEGVLDPIIDFTKKLSPESWAFIITALGFIAGPLINAGIAALVVALSGMAAAAWASASAFIASAAAMFIAFLPAMLAIAAVMALVVAYETNFGGLKDAVTQTGDAIREGDVAGAFQGIANALIAIPKGLAQELLDIAGVEINVDEGLKAWSGVWDLAKIAVDALPGAIDALIEKATGIDVPEGLKSWGGVFDNAKTAVNALPGAIDGLVESTNGVGITDGLRSWGGVWDLAKTAISAIPGFIDGVIESTTGISVSEGITGVKDAFGAIRDAVGEVPQKIQNIVEMMQTVSVPDTITLLKDTFNTLKDDIRAVPGAIVSIVENLGMLTIPDALNLFSTIFTTVAGAVGGIPGNIFAIGENMKNIKVPEALSSLQSIWSAIEGSTKALPDFIDAFIQVLDRIKVPTALEQIANLIAEIKSGPGGIVDKAIEIMGFDGNASGGLMGSGEVSWVGERGPELFVAPSAGRIVANHQLGSMTAGGGGGGGMPSAVAVPISLMLDGRVLFDTVETVRLQTSPG